MKKTGMILAVLSLAAAVSCSKPEKPAEYVPDTEIKATEPAAAADPVAGKTITWLGDYDLNPDKGEERSVALSIFEDFYHAKVRFVRTEAADKFVTLDNMLNSGEEVDLFPYDEDVFPSGMLSGRFQPLDEYSDILGLDEELWNGMRELTARLAYDGRHYVIPYDLSDPQILTYSRKLVNDEKLDDPQKLLKEGKWDWDAMMSMMEKFVAAAPEGQTRSGIAGDIGRALLQSTGHGIVECSGDKFISKLDSAEINKAGKFMEDISNKGLYRSGMIMSYPADNSVLFYSSSDWSLGESNAQNPDADLMIVPFPDMPGTRIDYISCRFKAKMLVSGSKNGAAAAAYIKCERIAATDPKYKSAAKKAAVYTEMRATGVMKYTMTEEQYDAVQDCLDITKYTPVVEFGYGMDSSLTIGSGRSFEARGPMYKLTSGLLERGKNIPEKWDELRDLCKPAIDEQIERYNN